jgi:dTDP-4-amino-4,6-dideoxygalactose transaminase
MISFNKPYFTGMELYYMQQCIENKQASGNGYFTKKCSSFFTEIYNNKRCLLTTSCTDSLEMTGLLANIHPGDEVIVPSYTFVTSALAFVREGATIVFADSRADNPCIDETKIEELITVRTKAIVVVHYAGIACDMDNIMAIATKYNLLVIEDAAQAIDSYYKGRLLGSIGDMAALSFHETKNIQCGEGGLLVVNNDRFSKRADIIWEKGTNRSEFFRGEVNKYGWKDTGSSFLPCEFVAACLWAQLEALETIQKRRKQIWDLYHEGLQSIKDRFLSIPNYATNNAHLFCFLCDSLEERNRMLKYLRDNKIMASFHYLCLHKSEFVKKQSFASFELSLPHAERYADCLVRLPLYYEMEDKEVEYVVNKIVRFYKQ